MRPHSGPAVGLIVAGLVLAGWGGWLLLQPPGHAVSSDPPASTAWFEEVAEKSGLTFQHRSGFDRRAAPSQKRYMPQIMAGGVGFLDYDGDGWLDLYFVQAGRLVGARRRSPPEADPAAGNRLYRNLRNGRFEDVTTAAGVGDTGYGMGCTCGDYNQDGWPDIYVTNVGANVLYRNNGDGTFTDVTQTAGVGDPGFSSSAAFVDYDHDGDLDLFVVNYVRWSADQERDCTNLNGQPDYCTPNAYGAPAPDTLYRNEGEGTFLNVTQDAGISAVFGNGLGIVCGDVSGDGLVDLIVANDLVANQLWINQGDGTFRDEALVRGVAYSGDGMAEAGMGIDARDFDADGDLDLFITHFDGQTNTFYRNEGRFFTDVTARLGLGASLPFTGFGTALIDLDNDGLLDIYIANGRVIEGHGEYYRNDPYAEPNQLFQRLEDLTFREVLPRGGTAAPLIHSSRGAAFGDYDNDGDIDIAVVNRDGPAYLLNNRAGHGRHWITFRVIDRHGSDAIGARVQLELNGEKRIGEVRTAYSYCAGNDPRVHFGLGDASRIDNVTVTWTDGAVQSFGPFDADQFVELRR